jgi:hypothetical protein
MRKTQAIRYAFFCLGLHTPAKGVVDVLAQQGIQVNEELVRQVRFELLKESTKGSVAKVSRPAGSTRVRHRPQGFPRR